jgi:hypothetical protein
VKLIYLILLVFFVDSIHASTAELSSSQAKFNFMPQQRDHRACRQTERPCGRKYAENTSPWPTHKFFRADLVPPPKAMADGGSPGSTRDIEIHPFNDPKAKEILDGVADRYLSQSALEIEFSLSIRLAEKPEKKEKGRIVQSNNRFKVETAEQDIYCDGRSLWYHLKEDKEVQINDYDGDDSGELGLMSPKGLLRQYESGEFEYALVAETVENNTQIAQIEFKPTDDFSDYSKLRVTIDKGQKSIIRVRAFGKDGSSFAMIVDSEKFGVSYPEEYFVFNPEDFPGVVVEDLRLD